MSKVFHRKCDVCEKGSGPPIPKGWMSINIDGYIYFDPGMSRSFTSKDLDFCSKECLVKWIESRLVQPA